MALIAVVIGSGAVLLAAYFSWGRWVARRLDLSDDRPTPAVALEDGVDFVPTSAPYLFSQHFSAIAAAGPIVGPIVAGLVFGWVPALIWILAGSIFVGAVHDMTALVASVRHRARSIAEIVREQMSPRAYFLFLAYVWIALVYIIVAFADLTATTFAPAPAPPGASAAEAAAAESAIAVGHAVAGSSMLYLALAVAMGLVLRLTRISLGWATAIFLPLVLVTIWAGPHIPLGVPAWVAGSSARTWDVLLLGYCFVAAVLPVWSLLQPRGYLGGYFLSVTIAAAALGIVASALTGDSLAIERDAYRGFQPDPEGRPWELLFPTLFVTVACGACSGFHSIISSGTSSKQLRRETDARPIAIGSMLLEAFVAVISLATVMVLARGTTATPDRIFADGMSRFIGGLAPVVGIDVDTARIWLRSFALLAFATFIYDTLDVCTRLGRYVLQELTGWQGRFGRHACTALTLILPLFLVLQNLEDPLTGKSQPAWRTFWSLFGTANQMLAALTLLGVTVWLERTGKSWLYTAIPAAFMILVTLASLSLQLLEWWQRSTVRTSFDPNGPLGLVLFGLALLLVVEACVVLRRSRLSRAAPAR